ncbi:MAG: NADH-binding protein [Desulfuromonas sp.]|uniref:NAD(P)H-binding protein n=1 Tax=Desulfuromonas sp. TaxID=892 RepID=UPI000CAED330|nr:NAD(P)H-binding protein [Desulfuromonas sp.]PLX84600.1 MAG: NADH-binding protein [Desulfuromonas sp.]
MEPSRRVLVTGATGFIGRRLVEALLKEGFVVRCLSRRAEEGFAPGAEGVMGDLLEPASLEGALKDVDTAYYLVHALGEGREGFRRRDREAAENFVAAAEEAGLRRTIYLGGLGESGNHLSEHLASRLEVAETLRKAAFPVTVLRAAVIIGAGGASYEILRSLVRRLPLLAIPTAIDTRCQPIAVEDVIAYLVGCLKDERTAGQTFDIGGPEVLSYHEMLERLARVAGTLNLYLPLPLLPVRLFAYGVALATPVKASVAIPLIEGLKNEVVCRDERIRELLPLSQTPFDEAVRRALTEEYAARPARPG